MTIIILIKANNKVQGELRNFAYIICKNVYFGSFNKRVLDNIINDIIIKNKASAKIIVEAKNEQGFELIHVNKTIIHSNCLILARHRNE